MSHARGRGFLGIMHIGMAQRGVGRRSVGIVCVTVAHHDWHLARRPLGWVRQFCSCAQSICQGIKKNGDRQVGKKMSSMTHMVLTPEAQLKKLHKLIDYLMDNIFHLG